VSWLASILKPLFEALLPLLFKKEETRAEDSVQAPRDLRRSWADRITDLMRKQSTSGDDSTDHMDNSGRGEGSD